MQGVLTKVFETHFTVHCAEINETVIVMADEIEPCVLKNLREQLINSNGAWAEGSAFEFELRDFKINGRFIACDVMVLFQGR
jgi:hypothetical protein